jgi:hypothetical protein
MFEHHDGHRSMLVTAPMRFPLLCAALVTVLGACKFPELDPIDPDAPSDALGDAVEDGSIDSPPAVVGGDTLAQTSFPTTWLRGTAVAAPGGGVIISFRHNAQNPVQIAGTAIPCTTCQVVAKLNSELTQVDWFAYSTDGYVREGHVATSPNGSVYWTTETLGDATLDVTLNGSAFASPITVHSPGSAIGEPLGGVRIVIAFSPTGTPRWTNVLTQSNTTTGNFLDPFIGFGASDGAVVATYAYAKGTLSYTNATGGPANMVVPAESYVLHEIDPATGRTVQLFSRANTVAGDRLGPITGVGGFSEKGFTAASASYTANGTLTGRAVMIGGLLNGGLPATVTTPTSTGLIPGRYKNLVSARAQVATSITVGSNTFPASGLSFDAGYFILDGTSSSVRASMIVGGSGAEQSRALVDVGNDDVYCAGTYLSSDLTIGETDLPDPVDASAVAVFVSRNRVDLQNRTLPPVWVRGFTGTRAMSIESAAADAVTGDLYLLGVLGPSGTASLGGPEIEAPANASAVFVVKIRRGD